MSARCRIPRLAFAFLTLAAVAHATTAYHLDTEELVRSSTEIVIGRVETMRSYVSDDRRFILTDVSVVVDDQFKGDERSRITLTQLGGEVDGMRYTVPGAPLFKTGEEALLFVWRDTHGIAQVNGLAQGKFDISRDVATGERFVQRSLPGLAVRDPHSLATAPEGTPAPRIPLGTMLREIRRSLDQSDR